ncbi:MAG: DNA-binding response regulator [Chitinophagales bacterium]|nr:MAG: DNA-binding response regulator [Chitinophagales bacterium]
MNPIANILIADDHQIVIDGLKSILNGTPYHVAGEAVNGQQALDLIQTYPKSFDVLITDISMPLLSGTELCKMVKHSYPEIKVLILSMYSSAPVIREALLAEADGFILKNAGKEELLKALHTILHHGTYYSDAIIPIIYGQIEKEKKQKANLSLLSKRELEILSLIVREYTSEQIAEKLFISKKTVDNHRANILEKTGCKSTIGLVKFALIHGIER